MTMPRVAVLDYGSGNVHSVVRALGHVGADVELTADRERVVSADGLLVPGVGNFHACMAGLEAVDGAARQAGGLVAEAFDDGPARVLVSAAGQVQDGTIG